MSEVSLHDAPGETTIALTGAIDASRVGELLTASVMACAAGKPVLLDWSAADHLHAGALQVLTALAIELASRGQPLTYTSASPAVRQCVETAGLHRALSADRAPQESEACTKF